VGDFIECLKKVRKPQKRKSYDPFLNKKLERKGKGTYTFGAGKKIDRRAPYLKKKRWT